MGKRSAPLVWRAVPYTAIRYFVAFGLAIYAFAKLFGAQFTTLESTLDLPLGDASGMTLVWTFFGYSKVYGTGIALMQLLGALLLLIPAGVLAGSLLLFAILTNIVVIDLSYGVNRVGTESAIVFWCCTVFLLWHHRQTLLELARRLELGAVFRWHPLGVWVRLILVPAVAAGFVYLVVNLNNRHPTPIDGRWDLVGAATKPNLPQRLYFERERIHLAVFRYPHRTVRHYFEVEPEARHVIIREGNHAGALLVDARYTLAGDRLELEGTWKGAPVALSFTRATTRLLPVLTADGSLSRQP